MAPGVRIHHLTWIRQKLWPKKLSAVTWYETPWSLGCDLEMLIPATNCLSWKRLCVNEMIVKTPKKRLVSWDKQKTFYPLKSSRPGWTSKVISVPYNGSGRIEWVSKYPDHRYPNPKKPVGSRLCTCASYTSPITIPLSCTLSLYKYLYLYL